MGSLLEGISNPLPCSGRPTINELLVGSVRAGDDVEITVLDPENRILVVIGSKLQGGL